MICIKKDWACSTVEVHQVSVASYVNFLSEHIYFFFFLFLSKALEILEICEIGKQILFRILLELFLVLFGFPNSFLVHQVSCFR